MSDSIYQFFLALKKTMGVFTSFLQMDLDHLVRLLCFLSFRHR